MSDTREHDPASVGGGACDPRSVISRHIATEFLRQAVCRPREDRMAMDDDLMMRVKAQVRVNQTGDEEVVTTEMTGETCNS